MFNLFRKRHLNNNEVKEVAKMQEQIDDYQSSIMNILLWLVRPGSITLKSNIPSINFIYREIQKLQKAAGIIQDKKGKES